MTVEGTGIIIRNPATGSLTVDDGTTTVSPVTEIDFTSGAVVTDLGGGIAGVAVGSSSSALRAWLTAPGSSTGVSIGPSNDNINHLVDGDGYDTVAFDTGDFAGLGILPGPADLTGRLNNAAGGSGVLTLPATGLYRLRGRLSPSLSLVVPTGFSAGDVSLMAMAINVQLAGSTSSELVGPYSWVRYEKTSVGSSIASANCQVDANLAIYPQARVDALVYGTSGDSVQLSFTSWNDSNNTQMWTWTAGATLFADIYIEQLDY